jgi:hypothetical protein
VKIWEPIIYSDSLPIKRQIVINPTEENAGIRIYFQLPGKAGQMSSVFEDLGRFSQELIQVAQLSSQLWTLMPILYTGSKKPPTDFLRFIIGLFVLQYYQEATPPQKKTW